MQKATTFLMFVGEQCGKAEEALRLYTSLFRNSEIRTIEHFKPGEPGGEAGLVKLATFTIDGQEFMANDSPFAHAFTFTPAISIFVTCESDEELTSLFATLSKDGTVMMELADHGFSKRFGWVADKYGVSWQLNLP
jgi:predicted 3-demethylubiquinone-9 3-methyltransferase (glyoxalase superfamily)